MALKQPAAERDPQQMSIVDLLRLVRLFKDEQRASLEPLVIDKATFNRIYVPGSLTRDDAWALLTIE